MPMGCGRGIHDGGVRLHPWSGHFSAHGTGGKTDTRMAAYPFDLPSIREGVDIQDSLVFSKPYRGLDWRPIPFETLQVEISLTHKGGKVGARHSKTFMIDIGWEHAAIMKRGMGGVKCDKVLPHYCPISTISTARYSS